MLSPGYFTGSYPKHAKCKWRIKVKENMVNKPVFYIRFPPTRWCMRLRQIGLYSGAVIVLNKHFCRCYLG